MDVLAYDAALMTARSLAGRAPSNHPMVAAAARLFMSDVNDIDDKSGGPALAVCKALGGHAISLLAESGQFPAVDDNTKALIYTVLIAVSISYYEARLAALKPKA